MKEYGYYHDANLHEAPGKLQQAAKDPKKQCILCGRGIQENEKDWRTILINHHMTIYICPDEFPHDDEASIEDFKRVYMKAIRKAWNDKS